MVLRSKILIMVVKKKRDNFFVGSFTLPELIITVAIFSVLMTMALANLKPMAQIDKAKDARRKSDLKKMQIAFEDYYSDHNCYPTPYPNSTSQCKISFLPYMKTIPCDPNGGNYDQYLYPGDSATCPQSYSIYTILANKSDPDISKVGCQNFCGPSANKKYNYGIWSSNIVLENSQRFAIPTPEGEIPTLPLPPEELTPTSIIPTLPGGPTSTPTLPTPTPTVNLTPTATSAPVIPTDTPTPRPTPAYACVNYQCVQWPGACEPNRPVYNIYQYGLCVNQCPTPANQCY